MGKGATLRQVAERAGVSPAAASAVLSNKQGGSIRVGESTAQRVRAAADELGYSPNRTARALRTKRSQLLGIVIPDITNPLFPKFVRAAQERAEELGYSTMVWDTWGEASRERKALSTLHAHGVDGIVLVSNHLTAADLRDVVAAGVVVAATDSEIDDDRIDRVSEDLAEGARRATRHLLEQGHTRIAHIAGDLAVAAGRYRRDGYLEALAEAGLTGHVAGGSSFAADAGERAMADLLAAADRPTAVYAANDMLAIGALRAARAANLSVPADVAVVGTDDIPQADVTQPALTTLDVRSRSVATRLVEVVVERIQDDRAAPVREIVTPVLVRRASS